MSANTQTPTGSDGFIDKNRERLFFAALIIGMAIFALGIAFGVLFVAMDTTPPAPYFASMTDKLLTGGYSLGFLIIGALIVRLGARLGGW